MNCSQIVWLFSFVALKATHLHRTRIETSEQIDREKEGGREKEKTTAVNEACDFVQHPPEVSVELAAALQ